jgi:hypothetical protein
MSDKQKQFVVDKIIEATDSNERFEILISTTKKIIRTKYFALSAEDFEKIWSEIGSKKYMDNIKDLYCQQFTLEELNQILSFWLSKPGQKLVRGKFIESETTLASNWSLDLESECKKVIQQRGSHEVLFG